MENVLRAISEQCHARTFHSLTCVSHYAHTLIPTWLNYELWLRTEMLPSPWNEMEPKSPSYATRFCVWRDNMMGPDGQWPRVAPSLLPECSPLALQSLLFGVRPTSKRDNEGNLQVTRSRNGVYELPANKPLAFPRLAATPSEIREFETKGRSTFEMLYQAAQDHQAQAPNRTQLTHSDIYRHMRNEIDEWQSESASFGIIPLPKFEFQLPQQFISLYGMRNGLGRTCFDHEPWNLGMLSNIEEMMFSLDTSLRASEFPNYFWEWMYLGYVECSGSDTEHAIMYMNVNALSPAFGNVIRFDDEADPPAQSWPTLSSMLNSLQAAYLRCHISDLGHEVSYDHSEEDLNEFMC